MQYNRFGNTGMEISRLGLGTMSFGAKVDLEAAQRITDQAIERGVNLIDTADTYGESEVLIGKILKANSKRENVFLCTKVYKHHAHGNHLGRNSRINIVNAMDNALRRLQVDHVDLFQIHHPDAQTPVDETIMALDSLVKAGKTRYVGCSNHYAWQIAYSNAVAEKLHAEPMSTAQNSYSLMDRVVELELLHLVRKFNVGFMAYSFLAGGLLARHYDAQHPIGLKDRAAEFKNRIDRNGSDLVYRLLDDLRGIAKEQSLSLNQLATAWLLSKPVVSTVLVAGSKVEHFSTLYDVADKPLDAAVVQRLDQLTEPAIYAPYKNQPMATAPSVARV
jgi:aryl-alcohol dehydrogenase-like predicted oxidoreductase